MIGRTIQQVQAGLHSKKKKEEREKERDFIDSRFSGAQRGLSYGAASHKDIAVIAQQKQKLNHMALVADVAKHSMVLQSKQDRLKNLQNMIQQAQDLGMKTLAKKHMQKAEILLDDIEKEEKTIINLSAHNKDNIAAAQVNLFLKQGAEAMGLRTEMSCFTKTKLFNDDDEDNDE